MTPKQLWGNRLLQDWLLDKNVNEEDDATATAGSSGSRLTMSGFG
jgi:hypothetical protein